MTWVIKVRGDLARTMVAEYECPEHGRFSREVNRIDGDPPPFVQCSVIDECNGCGGQPSAPGARWCIGCDGTSVSPCSREAPWVVSAPLCRVRLVEAIRGKSDKPERETWLDTTNVGEGQPLYEFREDRAAIRERQRQREYIELKKRGDL